MESNKTICYSYARVSSLGQIRGTGIERQIEKARDYVKAHSELILSEETFADLGKSSYKGEHLSEGSRLTAFLNAIDTGRIKRGSVLIIEALDRLSREEIDDAIDLFRGILKKGVDIITLSDEKRYTQNSKTKLIDWITSILYFDASNEYSRKLSDRVGKAWRKKQIEGGKNKPSHPAWIKYNKELDTYSVIDESADIVRRIFKEYLSGSGFGSIARGLNENKIKTLTGKGWGSVNVKFLLKSPSVIGEYHAKRREGRKTQKKVSTGIIHRGHYPAIISDADFHLVQEKLRRNPSKQGRPQADGVNLWDGLFKCAYCYGSVGLHLGRNLLCWNSLQGSCIRASWNLNDYELPLIINCEESIRERQWELTRPNSDALDVLIAKINSLDIEMANIMEILKVFPRNTIALDSFEKADSEKNKLVIERDKVIESIESFQTKDFSTVAYADFNSTESRLDFSRIYRKNIEKIVVYSVGEKGAEYREEVMRMRAEGERGDVIGVQLKKRFKTEESRFFEVHMKTPVIRGGKPVTCYRVFPQHETIG